MQRCLCSPGCKALKSSNHGEAHTYRKYACRCEPCRVAKANVTRAYKARKKMQEDPLQNVTAYQEIWWEHALCRGMDIDIFFAEDEWFHISKENQQKHETGLKVCNKCPVRDACKTWAIESRVRGTWGGTTYAERRKLRVVKINDGAKEKK